MSIHPFSERIEHHLVAERCPTRDRMSGNLTTDRGGAGKREPRSLEFERTYPSERPERNQKLNWKDAGVY
jgi:hypothetical protein